MDNMWEAYYNATKGKKHYREVKEIAKNPELFLKKLLYQLKNHKYKTSKYTIFHLYSGGKLREIYKLPMRDRIVQHALMNYLEPIFRKSFITDTYSSIKGRGIHMGMKRVRKALKDKENTKYCLKIDIKKFYPSINQDKLKEVISRKIKDKDLLQVLDEIIDSCDHGVPIGNYTSQYFANYFLTPFDHWIKEVLNIKYYFRYCDDIVILGKNKEYLKLILNKIQKYIKAVDLDIKPNWQIFPVISRGVDFLGYIFRPKHVLLRKHTKNKFIYKVTTLKQYTKRKRTLGSYWGIVCHANCRHLWQKYTGVKSFEDFGLLYKDVATATRALGEPLTILDYDLISKRNLNWAYIQAEYYGRPIVIKTISRYLKQQLHNKILPFASIIISHKHHYSFS